MIFTLEHAQEMKIAMVVFLICSIKKDDVLSFFFLPSLTLFMIFGLISS